MSEARAEVADEDFVPERAPPSRWALTPISDLVTTKSGDSKLIKGKLDSVPASGLFPAFSASGQDVWRAAFDYDDEAIILSAVGARCGKCFYASGKWSAIANTHVILPKHEVVSARFLWFLLNNEQFWVRGGSAQPFVRVKKTLERKIWLPPLAEQRRIVSKIDELFSEIEAGERALKRARAALARYRKSVLKAAVTGDLTADWRAANKDRLEPADKLLTRILAARREAWEKAERAKLEGQGKTPKGEEWKKRYRGPPSSDESDANEPPCGWVWTTVEECSALLTSGSRGWSKFYAHKGAIFVRAQNINTEKLVLDDVAYVALPSKTEGLRTLIARDDILITITGANVTKAALVEREIEEAYVNQHVALLRLAEPEISSYLFLWLRTPTAGNRQLVKAAYGAGKPGLNLTNIAEVSVALPPLAEQNEIVSRVEEAFSKADHVEAALDEQERAARALKQSILKAAFEGRLVPQDPADEPAAKLLERIRKAKR